MIVTKTMEEKKLTVKVEGRLDTATAPELENELAIHDQNVHDCKVKINIKESVLSGFRKEYMRKKAELYYEFAKEQ